MEDRKPLKIGEVRKSIITSQEEEDVQREEEFRDIEEYEQSLPVEVSSEVVDVSFLPSMKDSVINYVDEKVGKSEAGTEYTAYTRDELITFAKNMAGSFYANYIIKYHPSQLRNRPQIRTEVAEEITEFSKVFLTKLSEL